MGIDKHWWARPDQQLLILQVPYLVDPNTGIQLGDYKKILSYLFQTYAAAD